MRATEELGHRQEKRQAGRFFQNSVRGAPVFPRDVMSDERWEYARETLGLDPEAKDYMYFGGATWSLGGGLQHQALHSQLLSAHICLQVAT